MFATTSCVMRRTYVYLSSLLSVVFSNAGGNNEYFDVPDKTLNQLQTKKPLDHEQPLAVPYVLILATNDCTNKPAQYCSDIDATKGQYLNITINVCPLISFLLNKRIFI